MKTQLFYMIKNLAVALPILGNLTSASAATVSWLNYSSDPTVASGSVYAMPGGGTVTLTHNLPSGHYQGLNTPLTGSVPNYNWSDWQYLGITHVDNGDDNTPTQTWSITYTFSNPQPAGSLFFGALGLGSTDTYDPLGQYTTLHVQTSGTYLGEYVLNAAFGATDFTSLSGTFDMKNSVTGAGGDNPHWNTNLGIVAIDNTISSLTINGFSLDGDGFGFNVGNIVPEPTTASLTLLTLGLLARRRRSAT